VRRRIGGCHLSWPNCRPRTSDHRAGRLQGILAGRQKSLEVPIAAGVRPSSAAVFIAVVSACRPGALPSTSSGPASARCAGLRSRTPPARTSSPSLVARAAATRCFCAILSGAPFSRCRPQPHA
jgi:hypothetical protein